MGRRRHLVAAAAAARAVAVSGCIVVAPIELVTNVTYDSATFAYYGSQLPEAIQGPALVLDYDQLCDPEPGVVVGKIVVIGHWLDGKCGPLHHGLGSIYNVMDRAGAIALVYASPVFFPPGSMVYHYETWDRCRFCDRSAVLLQVSIAILPLVDQWRAQPELVLRLNPTATTQVYKALFDGMGWVLCFRVFLPVLAFLTAAEAISEVYRQLSMTNPPSRERESRRVSLVVCGIEGVTMLLVGLALLLGLYGPYSVPITVVNGCYALLTGSGIFTTFILALHLRQESRAFLVLGQQKSSIFARHKILLALASLFTVVPDLFCFYVSSKYYTNHQNAWMSAAYAIGYAVLQGCATFYFALYARALQLPLLAYLSHTTAAPMDSRNKIGRLIFWLSFSAVCMVGSFLAASVAVYYILVFGSVASQPKIERPEVGLLYFFYGFFRILVSTCQASTW